MLRCQLQLTATQGGVATLCKRAHRISACTPAFRSRTGVVRGWQHGQCVGNSVVQYAKGDQAP